MTVLEVLQSTSEYFAKKGIESPRLNIEHLLAQALGKKRIELYLEFDRPLSESILGPLREKVRKRGEGVPLQHLLGNWDFYGRTFKVDGRGLIPRPETECIIETALEEMKPGTKGRLVDVGTGSGILAITLALERPELEVVGVDISPEALMLARENAELLAPKQLTFKQSDLLANLTPFVDCIVANLPYIPTGELEHLQKEVRFDPVLALDGGQDGLDLIKRLVVSAPAIFAPNGLLLLELGKGQAETVMRLLAEENYRDISAKKDYQGVHRIVSARYG
jgi:release factor glutamine methyltransferase